MQPELRYDVITWGQPNPELDNVCPVCNSAVGFPCTRSTVHGNQQLAEVHPERLTNDKN